MTSVICNNWYQYVVTQQATSITGLAFYGHLQQLIICYRSYIIYEHIKLIHQKFTYYEFICHLYKHLYITPQIKNGMIGIRCQEWYDWDQVLNVDLESNSSKSKNVMSEVLCHQAFQALANLAHYTKSEKQITRKIIKTQISNLVHTIRFRINLHQVLKVKILNSNLIKMSYLVCFCLFWRLAKKRSNKSNFFYCMVNR